MRNEMKKNQRPQIRIGTSGWSYKHWKENFFPKGLKPTGWLNYYGSVFSTVEINTTFYHTPLVSTVEKWNEQVPQDFLCFMYHRFKWKAFTNRNYFFFYLHTIAWTRSGVSRFLQGSPIKSMEEKNR